MKNTIATYPENEKNEDIGFSINFNFIISVVKSRRLDDKSGAEVVGAEVVGLISPKKLIRLVKELLELIIYRAPPKYSAEFSPIIFKSENLNLVGRRNKYAPSK